MPTAVEITQYELEKEMYRKMGIDIEAERRRQAWEYLKPIRDALFMEQALKTETVFYFNGLIFCIDYDSWEIRTHKRNNDKSNPYRGRQIKKVLKRCGNVKM